ncbi:MAG: 30S ribosomal protein S20 [Candidatus Omnitrophica bacterium]|nr:30S ribosomal protein S20 [Candidatus Omnitrophota bacterium]
MPIKHAALRQLRKDRARQQRNQAVRSELKTLTKRLLGLLQSKKLDEAKTLIHVVAGKYDRAASKGVLHRNTAARSKSRLALQLNRRLSSS